MAAVTALRAPCSRLPLARTSARRAPLGSLGVCAAARGQATNRSKRAHADSSSKEWTRQLQQPAAAAATRAAADPQSEAAAGRQQAGAGISGHDDMRSRALAALVFSSVGGSLLFPDAAHASIALGLPFARDIAIDKDGFVFASLYWLSAELTLTIYFFSRFMMSWFPQVEKRRGLQPWYQIARVDSMLDPLRRLYGQRERALVRVRVRSDDGAEGGARGGGAEQGGPQGDRERLKYHWLGGVDVVPAAAVGILLMLSLVLGPTGALNGTEMQQELEVALNSVSVLQMAVLVGAWYMICARYFSFI